MDSKQEFPNTFRMWQQIQFFLLFMVKWNIDVFVILVKCQMRKKRNMDIIQTTEWMVSFKLVSNFTYEVLDVIM
jgi:hypothetical protein